MERLLWVALGASLTLAMALVAVFVTGMGQYYAHRMALPAIVPIGVTSAMVELGVEPPKAAADTQDAGQPRSPAEESAASTPATTPTSTATATDAPSATPTATGTPTASPTVTLTPSPTLSPTPLPARVKVPILMYHYIRVNPDPTDMAGFNLSVTPKNFEAQVDYLTRNGYHTVSFEQLVAYFKAKQPLPPKPIILTFDDGYRDFYTNAYPVLKKYGQTATVFIITDWVGRPQYLTSQEIVEMAANGIDFGGHTARHTDMRSMDETLAITEVIASKRALDTMLGKKTIAFAYPSGSYSDWAISLLKAAGYQAAVTTEYDTWHREADLLELGRVRVAGSTTLQSLAMQIQAQ
ncbi:MAG: polysaccharide deacetylase family protein [Bacteroidetes bacterium]|nr:polysaccharide deacetylase family protein [Bacteroidota bacterium]MCL5025793.1 polysaccharide deacetylase family protein [Chloroflexota bacterium]